MSTSPELVLGDFPSDCETFQPHHGLQSTFSSEMMNTDSRKRNWSQYRDDQATSYLLLHGKHENAENQEKENNCFGISEHRQCYNSFYSLDDNPEAEVQQASRLASRSSFEQVVEGKVLGHPSYFASNLSCTQNSTASLPRNIFPHLATSGENQIDLIESADECKDFLKLENTFATDINSSNKCACKNKTFSRLKSQSKTLPPSSDSTSILLPMYEQRQNQTRPPMNPSLPCQDRDRYSHHHAETRPYDEEAVITGLFEDVDSSQLPITSSVCCAKNDNDNVVAAFLEDGKDQPFIEVNSQKNTKRAPIFTNQVIPNHAERKLRKKTITVELSNSELWNKFHEIGTEMIITKAGRRMFPSIKIDVKGLQPHSHYLMTVDVVPLDKNRYRYVYHSSQWMAAGTTDACLTPRTYIHPDSPAKGEIWMRRSITFDKMKLTNYEMDKKGHVILHSMHKYLPRIHIIKCSENEPISLAKLVPQYRRVDDVIRDDLTTIIFEECVFTTVTAYQNQQITKLKIDRNPFAKGFRDSNKQQWRPRVSSQKPLPVSHFGSDNWRTETLDPASSCFVKPSTSEPQACQEYCTSDDNDTVLQSVDIHSYEQAKMLSNNILTVCKKSIASQTTQLQSSHSRNSFDLHPATSRSYFATPCIVQPPRTASNFLVLPDHYCGNMTGATSKVNSCLEINSSPTALNEYLPDIYSQPHSLDAMLPDQASSWQE